MKKLWKKFLATAIAMMMVVALLPAVAMADDETEEPVTPTEPEVEEAAKNSGSLTIIKNGEKTTEYLSGAVFTVYKLAAISNQGDNWTYTVQEQYKTTLGDDGTAKNLNELETTTWEGKIDTLASNANNDTTGKTESTATGLDGKTTISNLSLGIYLVKETTTPSGYVASKPFIVSIPSTDNYNKDSKKSENVGTKLVYDITAQPKNEPINIEKTVTSDKNVGIGETVNYVIETTIPNYGSEYTKKNFKIYDKMSSGLTLNVNSIKVYVEENITKDSDLNSLTPVEASDDTYTKTTSDLSNNKTFELAFSTNYVEKNKKKKVVVTYSATVNENAVYEIGNEAGLTYESKPGTDTEDKTDKENVYTYTIDLTKTGDKAEHTGGLNGAVFTLATTNSDNLVDIVVNGTKTEVNAKEKKGLKTEKTTIDAEEKDGKLIIRGLPAGTYTLTETESPAGYTLLKNPVTIVIAAGEDGKIDTTKTTVDGKNNADAVNADNGKVSVGIKNKSGFSLPSTGGTGTILYTAVGLLIMAGAALLMMSRKRRV